MSRRILGGFEWFIAFISAEMQSLGWVRFISFAIVPFYLFIIFLKFIFFKSIFECFFLNYDLHFFGSVFNSQPLKAWSRSISNLAVNFRRLNELRILVILRQYKKPALSAV